jgi:hypothetical protein
MAMRPYVVHPRYRRIRAVVLRGAPKCPKGDIPKWLCRPAYAGRQSHFFADFDATLPWRRDLPRPACGASAVHHGRQIAENAFHYPLGSCDRLAFSPEVEVQ